jgi:hypothetical protein
MLWERTLLAGETCSKIQLLLLFTQHSLVV